MNKTIGACSTQKDQKAQCLKYGAFYDFRLVVINGSMCPKCFNVSNTIFNREPWDD